MASKPSGLVSRLRVPMALSSISTSGLSNLKPNTSVSSIPKPLSHIAKRIPEIQRGPRRSRSYSDLTRTVNDPIKPLEKDLVLKIQTVASDEEKRKIEITKQKEFKKPHEKKPVRFMNKPTTTKRVHENEQKTTLEGAKKAKEDKKLFEKKPLERKPPSRVPPNPMVTRRVHEVTQKHSQLKVKMQKENKPLDKKARVSIKTTTIKKNLNARQGLAGGSRRLRLPADYKTLHKNLQDEHQSTLEEIEKYKEALEDIKLRYEQLEKSKKEVEEKHNSLQDEHQSTLEEIEKYKEEKETAIAAVEGIKLRYEQLEMSKKQVEEKHNSLKLDYQQLEKIISDMKRILEDYDVLKGTHENLKIELANVYDRLSTTEQQLDECRVDLVEKDDVRKQLLNELQDAKGSVRVYCRVRPALKEEENKLLTNIAFLDESTMELRKSKESTTGLMSGRLIGKQEFSFDRVFPTWATQNIVFEDIAHMVQSTLDGYNVCVFAYGQTGSGKTFTMQGNEEHTGMIPKSVDLLFKKVVEMKKTGWKFQIFASFIEIYNEMIVDLLNPKSKQQYDIHHNLNTTTVTNLRRELIVDSEGLYDLINSANRNRTTAATNLNEHSSRSHAITKIEVQGIQEAGSKMLMQRSSLNLIDLAGSESAKTSERMNETISINKSLSALGKVMLSLYNKESHVPYRDSKLTYLLQHSLSGSSKILMITNISPFEDNYNETINSLRFASQVKELKMNAKRVIKSVVN